ncbi:cysteine-rich protein [Sewage-associated tobamovirus]|nr:cysteine-rich protein [Sewage-associated tobamovirus]
MSFESGVYRNGTGCLTVTVVDYNTYRVSKAIRGVLSTTVPTPGFPNGKFRVFGIKSDGFHSDLVVSVSCLHCVFSCRYTVRIPGYVCASRLNTISEGVFVPVPWQYRDCMLVKPVFFNPTITFHPKITCDECYKAGVPSGLPKPEQLCLDEVVRTGKVGFGEGSEEVLCYHGDGCGQDKTEGEDDIPAATGIEDNGNV